MLEIPFRGSLAEPCGYYLALNDYPHTGSSVLPFSRGCEGSTLFLPFQATRLYSVVPGPEGWRKSMRIWNQTAWSDSLPVQDQFELVLEGQTLVFRLNEGHLRARQPLAIALYAKDLSQNDGWGYLLPDRRFLTRGGYGDQSLARYEQLDPVQRTLLPRKRNQERVRIYQLLPRLFGNLNEQRQLNGSISENGVGKFADLNHAALSSLKQMGFTHLWLTGIQRQATATDYSAIDLPADDPDLLKGLAGSPYAVKDAFDLCPDYACDPANRFTEFKSLLERVQAHGMKVIMDLIPNHVSRAYDSRVCPEQSFGSQDRVAEFFDPNNNFYHLAGQSLQLPTWKDGKALSPTCQILGTCDGRFPEEGTNARVTGNNVTSPCPSINDWYETVKLNYGFDFTTGRRAYPFGGKADSIPDTWWKVDQIIAYWQAIGVDGFRCDMAHMVPPEFWHWAIGRARQRRADTFFVAEAYNDLMKVPSGDPLQAALNENRGDVLLDLLSAGFNAVYDDPAYKKLKSIYDHGGWANDLDSVLAQPFLFENALRYAENHDEVRLAAEEHWGRIGMEVGRPVSAVLFGLGRGPLLLYSGQEVGEPARGPAGFGGDNARTTIFDYWSMPELVKWANGHLYDGARLSIPQEQLRAYYSRLIPLCAQSAFAHGDFYPLNPDNRDNPQFGRLAEEPVSGHWLYAFLRYDPESGQRFLVVANLHRDQTFAEISIQLSSAALAFLELSKPTSLKLTERLWANEPLSLPAQLVAEGIRLGPIAPLSGSYFELDPA